MADFSSTVDIIFEGVNNVGTGLDSAVSDINRSVSAIDQALDPFARITTALLAAETAVLAVGAAFIKTGVVEAGQFEQGFAAVASIIQAPADQIENLKNQTLEFSRTSTQSFEDIATAQYNAISAGVAFGESLEFLATAELGAIAGGTNLETSVIAIQQALNAFDNLTAEQALDSLFVTIREGVTTLPQLSDNLGRASAQAVASGQSFEQMNAAIGTLTKVLPSTSQAVTAYEGVLKAINAPSTQAADLAEKLKFAFNAQALAAQGLPAILNQVAEATNNDAGKLKILFGEQTAANAAFLLGGQLAEEYARQLEAQASSAGAAASAADAMGLSIDLLNQRLENAKRAAFVDFGAPLLDEEANIKAALASIFDAIGQEFQTGGGLREITGFIEQVGQELATTLEGIAAALPEALQSVDLQPLIDGFRELQDVFGVGDLTNAEELAEAIQNIVNALGNLQRFTAGTLEFFKTLAEALGPVVGYLSELEPSTVRTAAAIGGLALAVGPLASTISVLRTSLAGISALGGFATALGTAALPATATGLAASATSIGTLGGAVGALSFTLARATGFDEWANENLVIGEGTLGTAFTDLLEYIGAVDSGLGDLNITLEDLQQPTRGAAAAIDEVSLAADATSGKTDDAAQELGAWADIMADDVTPATESATTAIDASANALQTWVRDGDSYTQVSGRITTTTDDNAKKMEEAAKAAQAYQLKLLELATDERIALIEAKVELDIAQVQANAETVISAFESINTTIDSTGEVLSTLFGITENPEWDRFGFDIQRQIDKENDIREQAAEDQSRLVQAQIQVLEEQARATRRGDALITVNGDSLEPELRALSNAVFRNIQITAARQGVEPLTALVP